MEKQKYFAEVARKYPPREFTSGETFPLHGRNYMLKIVNVISIETLRSISNGIRAPGIEKYGYKVEGKRLKIFINQQAGKEQQDIARKAVQDWYTVHTEKKVNTVIAKYASALDVLPLKIKVVDQRSRWASCSKTKVLRFNWRLSMMPVSVLEYIVVHELCHLKVHDHSPRFWRIVKSVLPDYEKRRAWLRENGIIIALMF